MTDLTINDYTHEHLHKLTIKILKSIIKEKGVVKTKKCTRKQHYIECILENKDYIFGGEKPKKVVKKIKIKKTGDIKKVKIIKKVKSKPEKKLFSKVLRNPKTICYDKSKICVGIDEAGAGSMCHGVYVASCILPTECPTPNDEYKLTMWNSITDSKKYSSNKKKLHALCEYVKEVAIEWALIDVGEKEIDKINIRQARLVGFHRALDALKGNFNQIMVDGDIFYNYSKNGKQINHTCVKQGDSKYRSIAAASLIAKSTRDRDMIESHKEFPMYGWDKNFGYAGGKGRTHLDLIREYGITKYHRKTFGICKSWKTLPQGNLTDFTEAPKKEVDPLDSYAFIDTDDED